jgi:competence protein ComEA
MVFHRKRHMTAGLCIVLMFLFMLPAVIVAGDKININTADKDKLCELTGVGPAIAERIIEYREKNGPFKSVDELTNVKGIGEGILQKNKDSVVVK